MPAVVAGGRIIRAPCLQTCILIDYATFIGGRPSHIVLRLSKHLLDLAWLWLLSAIYNEPQQNIAINFNLCPQNWGCAGHFYLKNWPIQGQLAYLILFKKSK